MTGSKPNWKRVVTAVRRIRSVARRGPVAHYSGVRARRSAFALVNESNPTRHSLADRRRERNGVKRHIVDHWAIGTPGTTDAEHVDGDVQLHLFPWLWGRFQRAWWRRIGKDKGIISLDLSMVSEQRAKPFCAPSDVVRQIGCRWQKCLNSS